MDQGIPTAEELLTRLTERLACLDDLKSAVLFRGDSTDTAVRPVGSAEWTNVLLNTLLQIGADLGFEVWPRRKYFSPSSRRNSESDSPTRRPDDRGEWLVDASWTRYPMPEEWVRQLRETGRNPGRGIIMACESEWASGRFGLQEPNAHVRDVLDDFAKLTDIRAPLKVLIFAFQIETTGGLAGFEDIVRLCSLVASPVEVDEEYLLLGWPFFASWSDRINMLRPAILKSRQP